MRSHMTYDLHVHTHLSDCADKQAFYHRYIPLAEEMGQTVLGFADHSWADGVEGASPWYKKQPFSRLQKQKQELCEYLQQNPSPVKVLQGAEGEFANFLLGVDDEAAEYADYIIIPHDHVHMKGFVIPMERYSEEGIAKFLLESFEALCKHPRKDLFVGLCHPMVPCCHPWQFKNAVYKHITDGQLEDALKGAKEAGVWLELNLSEFADVPRDQWESYEYLRFFRAAKKVGNTMFWGSDAHKPENYVARHAIAEDVLVLTGLTDADFRTAETAILSKAERPGQ